MLEHQSFNIVWGLSCTKELNCALHDESDMILSDNLRTIENRSWYGTTVSEMANWILGYFQKWLHEDICGTDHEYDASHAKNLLLVCLQVLNISLSLKSQYLWGIRKGERVVRQWLLGISEAIFRRGNTYYYIGSLVITDKVYLLNYLESLILTVEGWRQRI
jgi:hypothetical protein